MTAHGENEMAIDTQTLQTRLLLSADQLPGVQSLIPTVLWAPTDELRLS